MQINLDGSTLTFEDGAKVQAALKEAACKIDVRPDGSGKINIGVAPTAAAVIPILVGVIALLYPRDAH